MKVSSNVMIAAISVRTQVSPGVTAPPNCPVINVSIAVSSACNCPSKTPLSGIVSFIHTRNGIMYLLKIKQLYYIFNIINCQINYLE